MYGFIVTANGIEPLLPWISQQHRAGYCMPDFWLGFGIAMLFLVLPGIGAMIWAYRIYRVVRKLNLGG